MLLPLGGWQAPLIIMPAVDSSWPKIGNEKTVEFLERTLKSGRIAQAYIFIGPDDLGKATIAFAFAQRLMGNALQGNSFNSDLHLLKAEEGKKHISIEQVRQFIKDLSLSSFLDSYRIGVIKGADSLTPEAQNAILKTLEEPGEKVVIILLARSEENLLPTILSRAQKLYFNPVKAETIYDYLIKEYGASRSTAKDLAGIALGKPLRAVRLLEDQENFARYLDRARLFLNLFASDINGRLAILDQVFNDRSYGSEATARAEELIALYEGLLRDLLLLHHNQPERLQHAALNTELNEVRRQLENRWQEGEDQDDFSICLLQCFQSSARAREYLASSVNPRLVLEQLVINLL